MFCFCFRWTLNERTLRTEWRHESGSHSREKKHQMDGTNSRQEEGQDKRATGHQKANGTIAQKQNKKPNKKTKVNASVVAERGRHAGAGLLVRADLARARAHRRGGRPVHVDGAVLANDVSEKKERKEVQMSRSTWCHIWEGLCRDRHRHLHAAHLASVEAGHNAAQLAAQLRDLLLVGGHKLALLVKLALGTALGRRGVGKLHLLQPE
jgi:hypothetical protein